MAASADAAFRRWLGLDKLPEPVPSGAYLPVAAYRGIAHVSGHLPKIDGVVAIKGKVGAGVDLDAARQAARLCVVQCLLSLRAQYGTLDRVARVLKLVGYVNSAPGFDRQPAVIDAASHLLHEIFGEVAGPHARSSVGVAELPQGAAVEIDMVVVIDEG